jgi:tetratricopeptide (TPR) repeat protein
MKSLFTVLLITSLSLTAGAQANEQMVSAFSTSYTAETAKDYAKAIADLKSVYSDQSYETNLRLGWLYYQKKEYKEAQNYYRQALKIKPKSIEAMFGFINPGAALQNWPEVFGMYQKIIALDPNNSLANYRIALMYYYRKEFGSAEKHLQKVAELYPFDYDIVLLLAQTKLALGKIGESKAYYQRALLYSPSNSEIKAVLNKL